MSNRSASSRSLAASLAFWAWCALVSYPMIAQRVDLADTVHDFSSSSTTLICQAIGLVIYLTTMFASHFAWFGSTFRRLNLPQVGILVIIYLSFALQLHGDENTIVMGIFYNTFIMVTALTLSVLWTLPPERLERCLGVASVILCLFGVTALAILGLPQDRNVGSIQPNLFAAPLLAGFILSQFRPGIVGILVRGLCLAMIALVSSRFALIGCMVSFALFELTFDPLSPAKLAALVVGVIAAIFFWPQIASIMALGDSSRDLSSGFSGRDQLWYRAIEAISSHPFGIGFKRAVFDEAGHNGYLKTILEFGVAGGGLIIFCVVYNIVLAGIEAITSSRKISREHRFASARFGGLVALVFGAFFQPQLLSLGDAFAMSFLLLLFKPGPVSRTDPVLRAHQFSATVSS